MGIKLRVAFHPWAHLKAWKYFWEIAWSKDVNTMSGEISSPLPYGNKVILLQNKKQFLCVFCDTFYILNSRTTQFNWNVCNNSFFVWYCFSMPLSFHSSKRLKFRKELFVYSRQFILSSTIWLCVARVGSFNWLQGRKNPIMVWFSIPIYVVYPRKYCEHVYKRYMSSAIYMS